MTLMNSTKQPETFYQNEIFRSPEMDISQFSLVVEQMQTCASQNIDGFDCFRMIIDMIEQIKNSPLPVETIET